MIRLRFGGVCPVLGLLMVAVVTTSASVILGNDGETPAVPIPANLDAVAINQEPSNQPQPSPVNLDDAAFNQQTSPANQAHLTQSQSSPVNQASLIQPQTSSVNQPLLIQPQTSPVNQSPLPQAQTSPVNQPPLIQPQTNPVNQSPHTEPQSSPVSLSPLIQPQISPVNQPPLTQPKTSPVNQPPLIQPHISPANQAPVIEPQTSPVNQAPLTQAQTSPVNQPPLTQPKTSPANQPPQQTNSFNQVPLIQHQTTLAKQTPVVQLQTRPVNQQIFFNPRPAPTKPNEAIVNQEPIIQPKTNPVIQQSSVSPATSPANPNVKSQAFVSRPRNSQDNFDEASQTPVNKPRTSFKTPQLQLSEQKTKSAKPQFLFKPKTNFANLQSSLIKKTISPASLNNTKSQTIHIRSQSSSGHLDGTEPQESLPHKRRRNRHRNLAKGKTQTRPIRPKSSSVNLEEFQATAIKSGDVPESTKVDSQTQPIKTQSNPRNLEEDKTQSPVLKSSTNSERLFKAKSQVYPINPLRPIKEKGKELQAPTKEPGTSFVNIGQVSSHTSPIVISDTNTDKLTDVTNSHGIKPVKKPSETVTSMINPMAYGPTGGKEPLLIKRESPRAKAVRRRAHQRPSAETLEQH